jgi:pantoate--beta-alanine ligase
MEIESTTSAVRTHLAQSGTPRVLVPTMGALHAGHRKLINLGRELAGTAGHLSVSVFVNPTQFGPNEDLDAYPRTFDADATMCREEGTDLLFAPRPQDVYPTGHSISVIESSLSQYLCGASRPGHFSGVCTIVLKLLNIFNPDIAVFGKKDYQQLAIIRRLVRDLDLTTKIVGAETVREEDGLALSSRNQYLSPTERKEAPAIRKALLAARDGGQSDAAELLRELKESLAAAAPSGTLDYANVVDAESLAPITTLDRPAVLAVAVQFGRARLIDNIELPTP